MRRRVLTVVVCVGFPVLLLHALALVATTIAPDDVARHYELYERQVGGLLDRRASVEVLNVGSSHASAIDFDVLGVEGHHLWRAGGDVFEAAYIVDNLAPRLPRLRAVLLSVDHGSLFLDNAHSPRRAATRRPMYAAVAATRPIPGDRRNFIGGRLHRFLPIDLVARADTWEGVIEGVLGGDVGAPEIPISRDGRREDAHFTCKSVHPDEVARNGEARAALHVDLIEASVAHNPDVTTAAHDALRATVRSLEQRGIEVILYSTPVTDAFLEAFPSDVSDAGLRTIVALAEELNLEHLDFTDDERFVAETRLFSDADHLNRCGGKRFSAVLRDALPTAVTRRP